MTEDALVETRAELILRYVQSLLRETRVSMESFAADVVEQYHGRTPGGARTIRFHGGGDAYKDMRANAQLLRRFLEGEVRLPVDLEEAVVMALPDSRRRQLLAALAARYGLLAVRNPNTQRRFEDDTAALAGLFKEAGEAGAALAPMLADGRFGPEDRPLAVTAKRELEDVLTAASGLLARIEDAMLEPVAELRMVANERERRR